MATLEELLQAAANADKAGDAAAAKMLVQAAEAMMKQGQPANGVDATTGQAMAVAPPRIEEQTAPAIPRPDVFGDTIAKATEGPWQATKAFAGGLADQSQSPTLRALPDGMPMGVKRTIAGAGDIGGMALSALGTGFAALAGTAGEMFGGSPTNEKKLARDLMMMGQVAVPELAGVSGTTMGIAGKATKPLTPKQEAARAATDIGVTPALGMTGKTGGMAAGGLEKFPFSGGIIAKDAMRAVGEVEGAFAKSVAKIGPATGPLAAGDRLQSGLGKFVEGFKTKSTELYSKVDDLVPQDRLFSIDKTDAALKAQSDAFKNNPKLAAKLGLNEWDAIAAEATKGSEAFANLKALAKNNPDLMKDPKFRAALVAEGDVGGIPWEALSMFRSKVGKAIGENRGALADEDMGRLKMLYGALTEDMTVAAKQVSPDAFKAWTVANGHYKTGARRIEKYLDSMISSEKKEVAPERAFEAFSAITKSDRASSDITRMREIKASLDPEAWGQVSASIVDRLGKARPGAQSADGDVFSPATFLTEWNKMSDEAKALLIEPEVRAELNKIAKVAESVKAAGAERNTSGTANAENWGKVAAGAVVAPKTTAAVVIGTNLTARALTSSYFLKSLNAVQRGDMRLMKAMAEGSGPFSTDAKAVMSFIAANQTDAPTQPARIAN